MSSLVRLVKNPGWVAMVARTWWAADQALERLRPRFDIPANGLGTEGIDKALDRAMADGPVKSFASLGSADDILGNDPISANYAVPFAPHAALEPMTATARVTETGVELWASTQSISILRDAVADALGRTKAEVTIYPTLVGGGFGRKVEVDAGVQAALISAAVKQPVQLIWSRGEDSLHGVPRPPAQARMRAKLGDDKRIAAWSARIAAPATSGETMKRLMGFGGQPRPEAMAVEGASPPYAIPALNIEHACAPLGVPSGMWRSVANSYTAFFTECFVDELAEEAGLDPLTFRLRMLEAQPRHAKALTLAAARGGWQGGGPETNQGLALHACFGSIVAMLAEAHVDDGKLVADRIVAAVDCGRIVNPDIVRQQIESGILWGLAAARDGALGYRDGLVEQRNFDGWNLPLIGDTPQIEVILIPSGDPPGGVGEIAVPPVAPALANAIHTATGKRVRSLPFTPGALA